MRSRTGAGVSRQHNLRRLLLHQPRAPGEALPGHLVGRRGHKEQLQLPAHDQTEWHSRITHPRGPRLSLFLLSHQRPTVVTPGWYRAWPGYAPLRSPLVFPSRSAVCKPICIAYQLGKREGAFRIPEVTGVDTKQGTYSEKRIFLLSNASTRPRSDGRTQLQRSGQVAATIDISSRSG
jgi:hypothetical protein